MLASSQIHNMDFYKKYPRFFQFIRYFSLFNTLNVDKPNNTNFTLDKKEKNIMSDLNTPVVMNYRFFIGSLLIISIVSLIISIIS